MEIHPTPSQASAKESPLNTIFVIAWVICSVFYFAQYALRSAPSIMMPEITATLDISKTDLASIIGVYFYAYAFFSLISGVMLDRIGPRFSASLGILLVALGCLLFGSGFSSGALIGRFLQGAGSGMAFTSAVFLASRGFPKAWLATAVGVTQCFGMLGGFMGQAVVSPVIKNGLISWQAFWILSAGCMLLVGLASLAVTPRTREGAVDWSGMAEPYLVVLRNPQSYLCALVAAMMFLPTNIGDFVWGTDFLVEAMHEDPASAAMQLSMVPLGWVIGCPLLGYLSDFFGRRKPVVLASLAVMLVTIVCIVYFPIPGIPHFIPGLILGIASGAAMIPYSMIKEVNPDRVKGTSTGVINFIVFVISAIMTNIFGHVIKTLAGGHAHLDMEVFQKADIVFVGGLILAMVLTLLIKETGSKTMPQVAVIPEEK